MSRRSTAAATAKHNLDALANSELRDLLVQYGFPNQPVTNSTRSVLIARLNKRMQEKGPGSSSSRPRHTTIGAPASSYLARYSSAEEESDRETTTAPRKATSPGNSSAPSSMPPPSTTTTKRKRATQQPQGTAGYSFFTPSSNSSVTYGSNNLPTIKVPIQPRSSVYIPPPTVHSSDTEDAESEGTAGGGGGAASRNPYLSYGRLSGLSFPKRYSTPPLDSSPGQSPVRSVAGGGGSPSSRLSDSQSGGSSGGEDSPYVSDFTKRLLQFRQEPQANERRTVGGLSAQQPSPRYFYRIPHRHTAASSSGSLVHQATNAGHGQQQQQQSTSISMNPLGYLRGLFHRLDDQYGVKQNIVPFVLVGAVVLFVAFLVFMYVTISPNLVSTITATTAKHEPCSEEHHSPDSLLPAETCIFESDLESALDFLRLITPELQSRAERHFCRDPTRTLLMTAREALRMRLEGMKQHSEYEAQRQLANVEYLLEANPQWRISNLNADGTPLALAALRRASQGTAANAFGITKPRLPLTCLFRRKLQTFFFVVGSLGLAAATAYSVNWFYKYRVRQKQERQQMLNRLISQILQVIVEHAAAFPQGAEAAAVVVNHLRDKIIDPANRTKKMEAMWAEAIAFLEHNESRVQFELGTRNGESCQLVRWVDTIQSPASSPNHRSNPQQQQQQQQQLVNGAALNKSGLSSSLTSASGGPGGQSPSLYNSAQLSKVGESMMTAKKWQSPAFDKSNKITSPPTPCLKIRQMFDKYEAVNPNLRTIIADAILEKVGPSCKIYDIVLEPQACCVYVRCASVKDAGVVHDEINGWWFDNRLVSIKFLRLERFMDRFPKSANSNHVMRPSNAQKLSLTQCNRFGVGAEDDDEEEEDMDEVEEEEDDMDEEMDVGAEKLNGRQ